MGIRTRRAHKHSKTHIVGFGIVGVLGFIFLAIVALAISLGSLVDSWLQDLPDYTSADAYLVAEPTQVYDADGNVIAEFYLENRRSVDLDQISDYVVQGTVDTEDVRFYQHNGIDPQGILRAVVVQLTGGSEGASTITQQLVRNTVLKDEQYDYTIKRKVREAYIAIEMEKTYSKDQILNMYLNTIYYGHGAYGIEAASITYFNKSASDLTLNEAATLIGIPNSPSTYDPTVNYDLCLQRRNVVLDRMLSAGTITQEEHDTTQAEEITLNLGSTANDSTGTYPYFTDYVKTLLQEDFGDDTIFKGGLQVYTTLNPTYQSCAEQAVSEQLDALGNEDLDCGLCAIDPSNGYIVAMVGGKDYNTSQYNLATSARRQVGSSFKAFTLTTAISQGMNPSISINCNSPMQITNTWTVQNFGNTSYGTISLAKATWVSSNTGYAQLAETVGVSNIVSTAKAMGIDVDLPEYASLTLGTAGIPPIQMAEAYATLASGGIHRDPCAITKILDRNGNTVYEHTDSPTQVVDGSVAYAVTQVLEGVVTSGTAASSTVSPDVDQPIAGKTGTSEDYRDLWFCGYTPQLSVAIWTGYREEATVKINGSNGHPYQTAVPIFMRFINYALADVERAEFTEYATPTYKADSTFTFSGTTTADTAETAETAQTAQTIAASSPAATTTQQPDTTPAESPTEPTTEPEVPAETVTE